MDIGSMTNNALVAEIGQRVQKRRLNLNISQEELAKTSGVSRTAICHLEAGNSVNLLSLLGILRGLDCLGEMESFLPPDQISPIQLAKLEGKVRQRSRKTKKG
jgi:transcriptional regulator with XRE-family HTH domain